MSHTLTIAQAHKKLQAKEISATELTQSCIDRIEAIDGTLNAVVYRNTEKALTAAAEVDAKNDFSHPLAGIPYLVKDVFCEEGVPTTACSNILRDKDYVPTHNSTTINRLNAVGAVSLGKVNTDEFTMGASTETSCYGVTKNPWDVTRVAGGSSGGSAASVAADECLFALGTDTGGSIRQPASFCGCVGMRNTYGRTSRYGVMSMASSLDTIGALTKTTEDLALVLQAIAGRDGNDATTGQGEVPNFAESLTGDIADVKIGVPKEYFGEGLNSEVETCVRGALEQLESMGAELVDISLPHTKYAIATYYVLVPSEVSSNMARFDGIRYGHLPENHEALDLIEYYHAARSEGFGDEVKRRIMIGAYALSSGYYDAYYRKAQKVRRKIQEDFTKAFETVDAIVGPVAPTPAFTVGAHSGDPVAMYLEDAYVCPQALAGIPSLSVPCGFTSANLPVGLQIMGPQWEEGRVLNVGYAYEGATNWGENKPSL